jgi:predicted anti-sigma-YlaC factor YlaD
MSTTDCSLIQPLLGAYLDGELAGETAESLAVHLETCEPCQGLLAQLAETDRLWREMRPAFPTEEEWETVEQRVMSRAKSRALRQVARTAAVAAAAAVLLAAIVWLVTLLEKSHTRPIPPGGGVTYQNEGAEDGDEAPVSITIERG